MPVRVLVSGGEVHQDEQSVGAMNQIIGINKLDIRLNELIEGLMLSLEA